MKPTYLANETSGRDRWTISYLDMITILMIFFVAVAAKSQLVPTPPPPPPPKPVAKAEPEKPKSNLDQVREKLKALDPKLDKRGLVISLPQAVLFASGDDRISDQAQPVVSQIADAIRDIPNHITLVGHADSIPIHNRRFRDNWELSAARGLRLLELLTTRYGIDESRLSVSSDGSNRPKESNDTATGRAENRRVEIVIEQASAVQPESPQSPPEPAAPTPVPAPPDPPAPLR